MESIPILAAGEVHVWMAFAEGCAVAPQRFEMLDPTEREAAMRFRFDRHRPAYILAHAMLRDVLGRYLDRSARDIQIGRDSFGKPYLIEAGSPALLHFNLSHSGEVVLAAVARDRSVGIDVEEIRPIDDLDSLVSAFFSPQEQAAILSEQSPAREQAFFRCWTRKESYIKALGQGMSIPLNSFDTEIASGESGRLLPGAAERPEVKAWWLTDLALPDGYAGALTVEEGVERLRSFRWQPQE